jgi:hypothetical protein
MRATMSVKDEPIRKSLESIRRIKAAADCYPRAHSTFRKQMHPEENIENTPLKKDWYFNDGLKLLP